MSTDGCPHAACPDRLFRGIAGRDALLRRLLGQVRAGGPWGSAGKLTRRGLSRGCRSSTATVVPATIRCGASIEGDSIGISGGAGPSSSRSLQASALRLPRVGKPAMVAGLSARVDTNRMAIIAASVIRERCQRVSGVRPTTAPSDDRPIGRSVADDELLRPCLGIVRDGAPLPIVCGQRPE